MLCPYLLLPMRFDRLGGLLVRLKRRHRNAHKAQRITRSVAVLEMDTSRDGQTGTWADFLFPSLGLLFEPDTSLAPNEVPDLVGIHQAGSDGGGFGCKGAVNNARFFSCKDPSDF